MKALILNSGLGSRMGVLTSEHPKCMTEISARETILSRQLRLVKEENIKDVIITTGYYNEVLVNYCNSLDYPLSYTFVNNPLYESTNYIYSIYLAREYLKDDDIVLMHGDLVFEESVFEGLVNNQNSCMAISTELPPPIKDFKAVIHNNRIDKIGIEYTKDAFYAEPLYKLNKKDWAIWLSKIVDYSKNNNRKCYAENAFNEVSDKCYIEPYDTKDSLCSEVDTPEDLERVTSRLKEIESRTVYMCFSTDMIHSGHISIINKAKKLGKLIIGVLSDEAVSSYKRFPSFHLRRGSHCLRI